MSNARVLSKVGRVAFHGYGVGTQSWSVGSQQTTIVQLAAQISMPGKVSGFNASTYQFTAPTDGLYMFTGKITQSTLATGPVAVLFKNGASYLEFGINYSVSYLTAGGTIVLPLVAGDVIDMRVTNYNNVAVTLDTTRCSLTGVLIG